jgi:hypothetical protein
MEIQPMMLQASVIRKDRYLETGGLPVDLKTREDTLLFFKLGLLFPACAVCGCGTVMMDDGNGRLTEEFNGNSVEYSLATVTLFEEVAALAKLLHHRKHKMLVEELSYAHFGLGRASGRRGMYLDAVRAILLSALTNQRVFRRCLQDSFKKRLFTLMM